MLEASTGCSRSTPTDKAPWTVIANGKLDSLTTEDTALS